MTDQMATELLRLENQLCFPLYAASRLVTRTYAPALKKLGITYAQYLVLMVLWEKDGLSVSEIGQKLFLDSGTLTPILEKLKVRGMVRRERDADDDRSVRNYLTVKASKLKLKAAEMSYALFCQSGLNIEELGTLRSSVKEFVSRLANRDLLNDNSLHQ